MSVKKDILRPFARRFFAGETLEDALERTRLAPSLGMGVTLDFLGEDAADVKEARAAVDEYMRIIDAVASMGPDVSLAVKMTHIGLGLDRGLAHEGLDAIAGLALKKGIRVWLDMEGSAYTDGVLESFERLRRVQPDCGIALQASLWRSWEDLKKLVSEGAMIRLVKGAYREPPEVAAGNPSEIRKRFMEMMLYLFAKSGSFAIGTHDKRIIEAAKAALKDFEGEFEFQMLMGMREGLKRKLVGEGKKVVEYVPYGEDWYGYGMRRLMEKRRNIVRFAEGLAGR